MSISSFAGHLRRAHKGVGAAGPGKPGPTGKRRRVSARTWTLIAFAIPSLILVLLINLYPVIYAGLQSLRNGTLISIGDFVGLENYANVLTDPQFWETARFTLIFTVVGVFGSWAIGLGLGMLLRTKVLGSNVFKVLLLLSWVVPVVVSTTSWNWLVATPQSPLPQLFQFLGFGNVLFLANPVLAQVTVCVFKVWHSFPFMMMMMTAALASVDNNVYEAARVDGAGRWQILTRITLPMIARTTFISWILMTIFCVNDFPTVYLLTAGGPFNSTNTLIVMAYQTVFQEFHTGPGVAIAFLMTLVLVVVSVMLYRQVRRANVE